MKLKSFLLERLKVLYREDIERGRREKEKISIECDSLEKYIHALDFKILKLKKYYLLIHQCYT